MGVVYPSDGLRTIRATIPLDSLVGERTQLGCSWKKQSGCWTSALVNPLPLPFGSSNVIETTDTGHGGEGHTSVGADLILLMRRRHPPSSIKQDSEHEWMKAPATLFRKLNYAQWE